MITWSRRLNDLGSNSHLHRRHSQDGRTRLRRAESTEYRQTKTREWGETPQRDPESEEEGTHKRHLDQVTGERPHSGITSTPDSNQRLGRPLTQGRKT